MHTALRHPITKYESYGILTVCPSSTVFTIPLGPTNPWMIDITKETLIFRRDAFSASLRLLVPTFLLPYAPPWVTPLASSRWKCSPTAFICFIEEAILSRSPRTMSEWGWWSACMRRPTGVNSTGVCLKEHAQVS